MIDKRLNKEAMISKWRMAKTVLFTFIMGTLIIGQAYLIATIIDLAFLQKEELRKLIPLFVLLFFVFGLRGIVQYIKSADNIRFASEMKGKFRRKLLSKYKNTSVTFAGKFKTGEQAALFTSGVDEIDDYYSSYLPQIVQAAIVPIMVIIAAFSVSIFSGFIMLFTAPLIPFFMMLIGGQAEKKTQEQMNSLLKFSSHFLETLKGIPTLKIFGQSKQQRESVKTNSDRFRDTTMSVLKIAFLSALMLEVLATISTAMIAVEVGLRLAYGYISFHSAFFVLLLAPDLYLPLRDLGSSFHNGKNSMAAAEKIWSVLDEEDQGVSWGDKKYDENVAPRLTVKDLSYVTDSEKEILSNIHLEIGSGERIAVVGASGSGKTTLLKLLMGLLPPTSGEISINGHPISSYTEESWFSKLVYVDQSPYLFSASLKENIAMSKTEATDEEVIQAAKLAGVDQFVRDFKDGYETIVGEGGRGLSGGEKQRVALARAFLKGASFTILDEPTAGLDLETENIILQAMEKFNKNGTVIMVAHRLQTIIDADKIVLLSEGQVIGTGSHVELLASSPEYKEMMTVYGGGMSHGSH